MKTALKFGLFSVFASLGLTVAPAAFAAETLEIRNFVGSINWSNGPTAVDVQGKIGDLKVTDGSGVIIDGNVDKIDRDACKSSYGRVKFDWFGKKKDGRFGGYENLKDYPVLNITLPADIDLIIQNSVIFTDGTPDVGSADIALPHCGSVKLGDVENMLTLDNRGSANVNIGDTGRIEANLRGSGDLSAGQSGDVLLSSYGSGDVELGNIKALEMSLHGSGDADISDIDGAAEITSHGSGDVQLGIIDGSFSFSTHGSGDLVAASVTGPRLSLKTYGSGDIQIDGGDVEILLVRVQGSGDADYAGDAGSANLRTSGSGDIYVNRVRSAAETKSSGSGDVDIDERG